MFPGILKNTVKQFAGWRGQQGVSRLEFITLRRIIQADKHGGRAVALEPVAAEIVPSGGNPAAATGAELG